MHAKRETLSFEPVGEMTLDRGGVQVGAGSESSIFVIVAGQRRISETAVNKRVMPIQMSVHRAAVPVAASHFGVLADG
jgi:hypothetical protein